MKNDKDTWDLISEVSKACKAKGESFNAQDPHAYAFGSMTGVLTGLPDTPENRSFLQKWLDNNKQG